MAQGKIRKNETEKVPFEKPIWFVFLTYNNGLLNEEIFQYNEVRAMLNRLEKQPNPIKIYAIWTGNWNTDLFEMDYSIFVKRIENEIKDKGYK